ncbi:hypothetical protein AUJ14_02770 [Candidatus Micrarchaeota archaeon CG1_02_55_22]|nr:MAG: hypothetical protein AUJ14_02770 [Candidatus Micrarchaeota archaeon CG1_02_55_22]
MPRPLRTARILTEAERTKAVHLPPAEKNLVKEACAGNHASLAELAFKTRIPHSLIEERLEAVLRRIMTPTRASAIRKTFAIVGTAPTRECLEGLVSLEIANNTPMHARYWLDSPTLKVVHREIQRRNKNDRKFSGIEPGFFGYDDWYTYLQKRHNISVMREISEDNPHEKKYKRKEYYPSTRERTEDGAIAYQRGELKTRIWQEIKNNPNRPTHQKYWLSQPDLRTLYQTAEKMGPNERQTPESTKGFFGHGNWYTFLEKEYGIAPVVKTEYEGRTYIRKKNSAELFAMILGERRRGAPTGAKAWQRDRRLNGLYESAMRRSADGKRLQKQGGDNPPGFMGHGSWAALMQKIDEEIAREHAE